MNLTQLQLQVQCRVAPAATPAEEIPYTDDTMEETGSEEQVDNNETVTQQSEEEVQSVRRSTQTLKPREMLTYDHLEQTSYQSLRPGENRAFAFTP